MRNGLLARASMLSMLAGSWAAEGYGQGCTPDPVYICVPGEDCGVACTNASVLFVDQAPCPNPHTSHPGCGYGGGVIEGTEPEVGGIRYWVDPGCDPQGPTNCSVHAAATFRSRGNNENPPTGGFYSPVQVNLRTTSGSLLQACGLSGGPIRTDEGETVVSVGARCSDPSTLNWKLEVRTRNCPDQGPCAWTICERVRTAPLDFAVTLGCRKPPTFDCSDECCLGPLGGSPFHGGGSASGLVDDETLGSVAVGSVGASFSLPNSGPQGMTLRYLYGGPGFPGNPENSNWFHHFGEFWSHEFAQRIVADPDQSHVWLVTESGSYREFSNLDAGGFYVDRIPADEKRRLKWAGTGVGWELHDLAGTVTFFHANGLWDRTVDPHGVVLADGTQNALGRLGSVAFADGRTLTLTYLLHGKISTVVEGPVPGTSETARTWTYSWVSNLVHDGPIPDRLATLTRPDGSRWRFTYDSAAVPHLIRVYLEGPSGVPSRVEAAWQYDVSGRISQAWKGAESYAASPDPGKLGYTYPGPGIVEISDGFATVRTFTFEREQASGKPRLLSVSGSCPGCAGIAPNSSYLYGDSANPFSPTQITDGRGFVTILGYDENGMLTSKREAQNQSGFDRTTNWTFNGPFDALATKVEGPTASGAQHVRIMDLAYEADGDLQSVRTQGSETSDPTTPSAFDFTTTFTYTPHGKPDLVSPPGFGPDDETDWDYLDPLRPHFPTQRFDALLEIGGATRFEWDGFNRKKSETDPNDQKVEKFYDALDRVTAVRVFGNPLVPTQYLETKYFYTALGDLGCVKFPRGNGIQYVYGDSTSGDPAGRLTETIRGTALANPSATNCLDSSQPRERRLLSYLFETAPVQAFVIREELQRRVDPNWEEDAEFESRFESSCRLTKFIEGANHSGAATTIHGYDCNGNLTTVSKAVGTPIATTTTYEFDPLNRVKKVSQPWGGGGGGLLESTFAYDLQDHLIEVIDGEQNETTFLYSDRDLLTRVESPVTGVTRYVYNEHGEMTAELQDSRGFAISRVVDAADRIVRIDYPGSVADVTFSYQNQVFLGDSQRGQIQVGHLFSISRGSSTTSYGYDDFWRLNADGELAFTLDGNGNQVTVQYPQGLTSKTTYDFVADRPIKLELDEGSGYGYVVGSAGTAASYRAFGPLWTLPFANTRTETRTFDFRFAPDTIVLSGSLLSWDYAVDALGDVTAIDDTLATNLDRSFGYQSHQRFLACASGPWTSSGSCAPSPTGGRLEWTYDRIGNRKTEVKSGTGSYFDTYFYLINPSSGNRATLDRVDRAGAGVLRDYSFDSGGFLDTVVAGANTVSFDFDAAGQLTQTSRSMQSLSYAYDGRGYLSLFPVQTAGDPPCPAPLPGQFERFCDGFGTGDTACWSAAVGGGGGGTCPWQPLQDRVDITYSSQGQLLGLDRTPAGASVTRHAVLYFGDRPVALWKKPGGGASVRTYLTTDHLGTPVLATNSSGLSVWSGGFEPFGRDYSIPSAETQGIYIRLPGQWEDALLNNSTLGADLHYNVHRWLEPQSGRYVSPDPIGLVGGDNLFSYALQRPLRFTDPLGLATFVCDRPLKALPDEGRKSGPEGLLNPLYHQFYCVTTPEGFECHGQSADKPWGAGRPTRPDEDFFSPARCTQMRNTDDCFDDCMRAFGSEERPEYGLFGPGINCQEWTSDAITACREKCGWPEPIKAIKRSRPFKYSRQ